MVSFSTLQHAWFFSLSETLYLAGVVLAIALMLFWVFRWMMSAAKTVLILGVLFFSLWYFRGHAPSMEGVLRDVCQAMNQSPEVLRFMTAGGLDLCKKPLPPKPVRVNHPLSRKPYQQNSASIGR